MCECIFRERDVGEGEVRAEKEKETERERKERKQKIDRMCATAACDATDGQERSSLSVSGWTS